MTSAVLTSIGKITIPAFVRKALGVDSGDRIDLMQIEKGRFEIVPKTLSVKQLKGMIRKPAKSVSIDEMNRAITAQGDKPR